MKKLLTLALSVFVVAGCSVELGENPDVVEQAATKICPEYSANKGSVIGQKPTCCYDADTCHVTRNGNVVATFYEADQSVPHIRIAAADGAWTSSPADLPENRGAKCACIAVHAGEFFNTVGPQRCYIANKLIDSTVRAAAMCFRPNIGERAFWVSGASANCHYTFDVMPEGFCG